MGNKVPFVRLQLVPILQILMEKKINQVLDNRPIRLDKILYLRKVHFFCCPEGGLSFLVHLPDVLVLNGEENKPPWVGSEKRLGLGSITLSSFLYSKTRPIRLNNF